MNKQWIDASFASFIYYNTNDDEGENLILVRRLDIVGLFETSWMVFDHPSNIYGYPIDDL